METGAFLFQTSANPANPNHPAPMPRTLYSPRLSDDVVRALYREGQRRRMPMTRLADTLLRQAIGDIAAGSVLLRVCDDGTRDPHPTGSDADAA